MMLDSFLVLSATKDPTAVERANLLNMAKLSIKGLIESALSFGRTLDSDYPPLQQFFVVMEHCLKHGLKGTGKFLKNQLWSGPPPILNVFVEDAPHTLGGKLLNSMCAYSPGGQCRKSHGRKSLVGCSL